jgi:hypothetical protein
MHRERSACDARLRTAELDDSKQRRLLVTAIRMVAREARLHMAALPEVIVTLRALVSNAMRAQGLTNAALESVLAEVTSACVVEYNFPASEAPPIRPAIRIRSIVPKKP